MEIFRYYGKIVKDFDFVSIQKKTAVHTHSLYIEVHEAILSPYEDQTSPELLTAARVHGVNL